MAQQHLLPKDLVHKDVERFRPRIEPPLRFIPTKREESAENLTTVKVKISDVITETVTAFMGTDPESYIGLIDSFTGISRKMDLRGTYQEALRRLEDAVICESCHVNDRPSDEEGATPPAPELTGTDTSQRKPLLEVRRWLKVRQARPATLPQTSNPGQGRLSQTGGGGRHLSPTQMDVWVLKWQSLKDAVAWARKETSDAIKKIFEIFESLLGQTARERWAELLTDALDKDGTRLADSTTHESWDTFRLCQRKFLLEVFEQDAAEQQREYLLQGLKITDAIPLRKWLQRVRYLLRTLEYLPCLADSPETPLTTELMDKPLGETELCNLIMRTIPPELSEQYHLDSNDPRVADQ